MIAILGLGVVLFVLFGQLPDKSFHIYFLDVGQGDSIYIKTPQNHQILVDAGAGDSVIDELSEVIPFFDKSIDLIVLTHPDKDHVEGFSSVLEKYKVENVLLTGVQKESKIYEEVLEKILKEDCTVFIAQAGSDFKIGEVILDIIFPLNQAFATDPKESNNVAVAMRVIYKDKIILLTADLEEEIENKLAGRYKNLQANIFKAGHHGSKTSTSEKFLKAAKPDVVVISAGKNNSYGHPHQEVVERLEKFGTKIRRTDLEGRIEYVFE